MTKPNFWVKTKHMRPYHGIIGCEVVLREEQLMAQTMSLPWVCQEQGMFPQGIITSDSERG